MSGSSAIFLIGLGAMGFVVAALCLFGYDVSTAREVLRQRVDLLGLTRRVTDLRSQSDRRQARADRRQGPRRRPASTALSGNDLELARWLQPFHIPAPLAPHLLLLVRLSASVVLGMALLLLGYRYAGMGAMWSLVAIASGGAALGWLIPSFALGRFALNRRRAIARGLADAIELLVIAVEAGLSLEDAMHRIVVELRRSRPAIADELAITSADLRILPSRDEALRRLAERVDLPSVHSVVTTLSQTLKYGTPLAQALRTVAEELRNDGLLKLEEQANRMPVLLTVPMILFILPSLFLIIGGPAFLKVLDAFAR
ncbi:MAG TPA: type II secretion system F family protein [Stellaceae bacterium]